MVSSHTLSRADTVYLTHTLKVLLVLLSFCSGVVSVYGCWLRRGIAATDRLYKIRRGIVTVYVLHYMNKEEFVTYAATLHSGSSKLIWTLFYFPASKVYTNSLLAMLNLRHWLRGTSIVDYVELGIAGAFEDNSLSPKRCALTRACLRNTDVCLYYMRLTVALIR
ncbi:hypothetical protein EVJ58_g4692 [Rhodofomes roseus]|uniref:DUF6534 domain-containing protein n=1 Tax=Rhodofomes roseus TaxID=34475 RepID=A0A4Y9YHS3_9APHY|nr:hypothetical protein EVJ58_g4692 [Rhodofomes roseus]